MFACVYTRAARSLLLASIFGVHKFAFLKNIVTSTPCMLYIIHNIQMKCNMVILSSNFMSLNLSVFCSNDGSVRSLKG